MSWDERGRIEALHEYGVLDTPGEAIFDSLARATAKLMSTPISLVTLVDEKRQWFKARYGVDLPETPREWSFCDHAVRASKTLLVPDAAEDPRFASNPLVTGEPYIRFYCGVPLRTPQGYCLGALCAIDRAPRTLSEDEVKTLEALARHVEIELEIRRRLVLLEAELRTRRKDQLDQGMLAAMVVHDLRSPLTAISLLAGSIRSADGESATALEELLCEAERARRMMTDVLDVFLHQSGGLRLRPSVFPLAGTATTVKRRLTPLARAAGKVISVPPAEHALLVRADAELVGRVIENLVANAIHHGSSGQEVSVALRAGEGRVWCEVRDRGETIPETERAAVFEPRMQGSSGTRHRGHGLGLTFCRLAVEAHGGRITIRPNDDGRGNCFAFDLPLAG